MSNYFSLLNMLYLQNKAKSSKKYRPNQWIRVNKQTALVVIHLVDSTVQPSNNWDQDNTNPHAKFHF